MIVRKLIIELIILSYIIFVNVYKVHAKITFYV